ncbi:hypothetical protein BC939DRAFT_457830 [Gamsiella multidivaricata]|uniref:uncharacterized protein n=1 Tax=Gamsiella multidivaricata TaxID=101098 RepID=UPI00221EB8E6|nr:uncharacterized protein BC939DRAFT_457830 [Gamsiella multidivaricata]KAG0366027.1 hypothetical protein BGZ54_005921 [Gamsiella multidivaricata]KAI7820387.1 hypothetical protein BC939DRAFT_457830 [Gamsiella multidivaricata]
MGRRLSMFCPCLPRKQRDNLLSRSLYPDQDSSGHEDYSDEDDNGYQPYRHSHTQSHYPHTSRARLQSMEPSSSPPNASGSNNDNPWPSRFSNGRLSRHANQHSSQDRSNLRKPNPFRTPYRDDDNDDDEDQEGVDANGERTTTTTTTTTTGAGITSFEPYRDDDSEEDSKAIHPKMDYPSNRIRSSSTTATSINPSPAKRFVRAPRNPQGKSMAWGDEDDGYGDAEEVIDVDALIAEQERITKELAAQEEALRKEEEAAIVAKRMAAIRAAERRGLLRFEGDQLVIPGSSVNSDNDNDHESKDKGSSSAVNQGRTVQDDGDWNYSRRIQQQQQQQQQQQNRHPMERTTSSAASSYVGGIDAFNQELKMMSLDINRSESKHHNKNVGRSNSPQLPLPTPYDMATTTTATPKPARISTLTSAVQTTPKTVSTGVSTSSSSTLSPSSVMISPRGVFNSVATFLKKVDGVIAGESGDSSDEATLSDKEQQQQQQQKQKQARGEDKSRAASYMNGPQSLTTNAADDNVGRERSSGGGYSTVDAEGRGQHRQDSTVAIHLDAQERPYPEDPFNTPTGPHFPNAERLSSYSTDPSNVSNTIPKRSSSTTSYKAPEPSKATTEPVAVTTAAPEAGMFGTFTSFFNTGSSLMGFFGGSGGDAEEDERGQNKEDEYGRRLSSLKYGDPKKHRFSYRKATVEDDDDDDDDGIDDYNF